jgi:hypothetical protein
MRCRFTLFLLSCGACAHTQETGATQAKEESRPTQSANPVRSAQAVTPKTEPGHPALAASPDELMRPNSVEKISKALVAKGFLASAEPSPQEFLDGVKAFQRSRGLAATGFADHETLMRLGISPGQVDKSLDTPDLKTAKTNGTAPQP